MYKVEVEWVRDGWDVTPFSSEIFATIEEARKAFESWDIGRLWRTEYLCCTCKNEMRREQVTKTLRECDNDGWCLTDEKGWPIDSVLNYSEYGWDDYRKGRRDD